MPTERASVHNVLWTSGWDSTYRVADLLLTQGAHVQPWYVIDPTRRSAKREIATIDRIRDALIQKDSTVADRLLPLRIRQRDDIPTNPEVTAHFMELTRNEFWGGQYEWLARLAAAEDVDLEISLKSDDRPSIRMAASIVPASEGRFALGESVNEPAFALFERFRFPVFDITKSRMHDLARKKGFADILEMTWFCHSPSLWGAPCGFCGPCTHAREEGFGWRVPAPTLPRRAEYMALRSVWLLRQKAARRAVY
ncbi:hypothetical protein GS446_17045 [Rhodococcus hoagii]|nr:hypothetical protein [Prescottella equi]